MRSDGDLFVEFFYSAVEFAKKFQIGVSFLVICRTASKQNRAFYAK